MLPARVVIGGQKHKKDDDKGSRARWNTPHAQKPGMTYASRLSLSFALTSLMTVLILVAVVTVVWGSVFSDYTRANVADIASMTARKLAEVYEDNGDEWKAAPLSAMAENTVNVDVGMQVLDAKGKIVYDDSWPAASLAAQIEQEAEADALDGGSAAAGGAVSAGSSATSSAVTVPSGSSSESAGASATARSATKHSLISTAPTDQEGAVSEDIVSSDGEVVGTLRMWVLGSDALLTKADTAFREKTFNAMGLAAFVAIIMALITGFFVSRMLTNPIRRITSTAKQIRDGDLSARTEMHGNDEIDQLGETFDEMATSLEKDLRHERRLTSDVAHELRTPLMAMLATVEAMQDGVYPTDGEHLETVASETRRLARLVQQMLDLSRNENRTVPLNIEKVDVLALARNIVDAQRQLFEDRDLHLRFADETQGRGANAEIDPDMITQAIINILSNAMRYTPEDGWVVVSVAQDRQRREVLVTVSDTGIGIAKEDLSRIFGRFWRADASRAREAGGLGVGLAVTKQIIERHHGFIAVESELGKGTTFVIHLPREHVSDGPAPSAIKDE